MFQSGVEESTSSAHQIYLCRLNPWGTATPFPTSDIPGDKIVDY